MNTESKSIGTRVGVELLPDVMTSAMHNVRSQFREFRDVPANLKGYNGDQLISRHVEDEFNSVFGLHAVDNIAIRMAMVGIEPIIFTMRAGMMFDPDESPPYGARLVEECDCDEDECEKKRVYWAAVVGYHDRSGIVRAAAPILFKDRDDGDGLEPTGELGDWQIDAFSDEELKQVDRPLVRLYDRANEFERLIRHEFKMK